MFGGSEEGLTRTYSFASEAFRSQRVVAAEALTQAARPQGTTSADSRLSAH
jgi:hypothetical protein